MKCGIDGGSGGVVWLKFLVYFFQIIFFYYFGDGRGTKNIRKKKLANQTFCMQTQKWGGEKPILTNNMQPLM